MFVDNETLSIGNIMQALGEFCSRALCTLQCSYVAYLHTVIELCCIIFQPQFYQLGQLFNFLYPRYRTCCTRGRRWVSWYQKGKTNLDFTEARDSEWQWHQLGHMQVCTSLHTDNHASTPPLSFLQAGCPSCRPTNSVKALKARRYDSPADNCFNLGTDEKDRIYNTGVMTGHLANGERYGVDGVTIGEANKRLVVCKQLEQEFVATETQNSISSNTHTHTV